MPSAPQGPPAAKAQPSSTSRPRYVSAVETKPMRAPAQPAPEPEPVTTPDQAPRSASAVNIPWVWVYWGVTGLVLLFVLIWWGGVNAGKQDAERRYGKQLSPQNERPTDDPQPSQPQPSDTPPAPVEDPRPDPAPPAPQPGDIYLVGAWVADDPRIKGMNYLHLVVLPKPDAARAVDYLRSKGRQAVAVPSKVVDRSPDGDKNPSYFVYLLTPLSKDQYRDAANRTRIENDVKALGKEWAKSKDRGPSDFSQPGWVKYD